MDESRLKKIETKVGLLIYGMFSLATIVVLVVFVDIAYGAGSKTDPLLFVSEVVKAIAWPAVVVLLAFRFEKSLATAVDAVTERIGKINRVGGKEWSVDFEKRIAEAEATAEKANLMSSSSSSGELDPMPYGNYDDFFSHLGNLDPAAAVYVGWLKVEQAISDGFREIVHREPNENDIRDFTRLLAHV